MLSMKSRRLAVVTFLSALLVVGGVAEGVSAKTASSSTSTSSISATEIVIDAGATELPLQIPLENGTAIVLDEDPTGRLFARNTSVTDPDPEADPIIEIVVDCVDTNGDGAQDAYVVSVIVNGDTLFNLKYTSRTRTFKKHCR